MADKYFLARFKFAHESGLRSSGAGTYEDALAEIKAGRKRSHWMWYIFPQIVGFGHSSINFYYSIKSPAEAKAYLEDELLNAHMRELCQALLDSPKSDPGEIFGYPDWLKLGSSMTLFDYVSPNDIFDKVLKKFFGGNRCTNSLSFIRNIEARQSKDQDSND